MPIDPPEPPKNPAGQRVSLRDIAKRLGVSHATVSLALRDSPRISTARREEIQALAKSLGYRPDPMLSSLSSYRNAKHNVAAQSSIAWINQWKDPKDLRRQHEFDAYWEGAATYAEQIGYRLEEFVVTPTMTAKRLQQILQTRQVQGILIPPHSQLKLDGFDWDAFSIVRLSASINHPRAHLVSSDQMDCAVVAFRSIWNCGYRRIAYVTSKMSDRSTGRNFRAGYLNAQDMYVSARHQLEPLTLNEDNSDGDVEQLRKWLEAVKPDAILTAIGNLPEIIAKLDCDILSDVGVATLSLLDGHYDAGVDQNSKEVGRVGMAMLAGLIHQNERGIPQYCRRILVEGRWVDGSSLPRKTRQKPLATKGK